MAAEQSKLEYKGFEERQKETAGREFNRETNEYSRQNDAAKTHDDANHPWGKGAQAVGQTYYLPSKEGSTTLYKPTINNEEGGGSYDIYGKDGNGGRNRLMAMNLYNKEKSYSRQSIDTHLNEKDGQYTVTQ